MRRYTIPLAAAFAAMIASPTIAAAQDAVASVALNMRAGPSTEFPVVDVLPDGAAVDVHGCVNGYSWCDVTWRDARGWVSASYLQYSYQNRYVPIVEYGPRIDLPIIEFSVGSYWDNHYRGRPWYGQRARWSREWRSERRENRAERREQRREERVDRRRDRRDDRVERREDRRQDRVERRENRAVTRENRRDNRADRVRDRREDRTERRQQRESRAEQSRNRRENEAQRNRARRGEQRPTSGRRQSGSPPAGQAQESRGRFGGQGVGPGRRDR
jgi:uncharacterized protein YraI